MFREAIPELSQAAFVIAPDFRLLGTYPLRKKFYWCPVAPTFKCLLSLNGAVAAATGRSPQRITPTFI